MGDSLISIDFGFEFTPMDVVAGGLFSCVLSESSVRE